jgi:hypothetical protein
MLNNLSGLESAAQLLGTKLNLNQVEIGIPIEVNASQLVSNPNLMTNILSHGFRLLISDSSLNLANNLDALQTYSKLGPSNYFNVSVTDHAPLLITATQASADSAILNLIQQDGGNYAIQGSSNAFPSLISASVIAAPNSTINLSSCFQFSSASNLPTFIDVTLLDRHEYPGGFIPIYGSLLGNGQVVQDYSKSFPAYIGGGVTDAIDAGVVFSLQANGRYYNTIYGYFDQMQYIVANNQYNNTYISIFGTNSLSVLQTLAAPPGIYTVDPTSLAEYCANGGNINYLGSVDVVARNDVASAVHTFATPSTVIAAANSFAGKVWNNEGCWVLASNISALAGASLPITSAGGATPIIFSGNNITPLANGEWIVAYFGGNQANPSISLAESKIRAGDIVTVYWSGGGGHIFTVVSGSGANAMIFDNAQTGSNSAHDGNLSDIIAGSYYSVYQEFTMGNAIASSVVVYRLDTPTINIISPTNTISAGQTLKLSPEFSVSDAAGAGLLPITKYAFYDVGTGSAQNDTFIVGGVSYTAHAAGSSAIVVDASNLSSVALSAASGSGGTDTVYVSAYNGNYWGDWATFSVVVSSPVVTNPPVNLQPNTTYAAQPNQTITGATGVETVTFNEASTNFTITISGAIASTVDSIGSYGTNTLSSIERLHFTNTNIALDIDKSQVAGEAYLLYQAAFNRHPDTPGVGYWIAQLDKGANLVTDVAQAFINSPEFISLYGANPSVSNYVNLLYQNVLHRAGETGGVNYWNGQLNNNTFTRAQVLEYFAASPENVAAVAPDIAHGIQYQQWVG